MSDLKLLENTSDELAINGKSLEKLNLSGGISNSLNIDTLSPLRHLFIIFLNTSLSQSSV